ncbi:hypothetical protein EXIGLDRAFT_725654 [Exidia glandulosa HHB12029]|uniref:Uncharacterized protein n=1 Tax=Exidia glandulosa HHB12029 TaxID=1314781 RepID=A0A165Q7C2_EXIGL|nr:hypothetical protein EXIGLDRAFT_725654 [Exidia glandulosa HHB12029]
MQQRERDLVRKVNAPTRGRTVDGNATGTGEAEVVLDHAELYDAFNESQLALAETRGQLKFVSTELDVNRRELRALRNENDGLLELLGQRITTLEAKVDLAVTQVKDDRGGAHKHPELAIAVRVQTRLMLGVDLDDHNAILPDPLKAGDPERVDESGGKLWNPHWGKRVDAAENKAFVNAVTEAVIKNETVKVKSDVPQEALTKKIVRPIVTNYVRHLDSVYASQNDDALREKKEWHAANSRRRMRRDTVAQARRSVAEHLDKELGLPPGTVMQAIDTDLCSDRISEDEWTSNDDAERDVQGFELVPAESLVVRRRPAHRNKLCTTLYYRLDFHKQQRGDDGYAADADIEATTAPGSKKRKKKNARVDGGRKQPRTTTLVAFNGPAHKHAERGPSKRSRQPPVNLISTRWLKGVGESCDVAFAAAVPQLHRGILAHDKKLFSRLNWLALDAQSDTEGEAATAAERATTSGTSSGGAAPTVPTSAGTGVGDKTPAPPEPPAPPVSPAPPVPPAA